MGVRAADQAHVDHPRERHIVREQAAAGDEARVFLALEARPDVGGRRGSGHRFTSAATFDCELIVIIPAADLMAFTMLWKAVRRHKLPSIAWRISASLGV